MVDQLWTEERALQALRTVMDPEVGMNIVDLGLVYRIEVLPQKLCVDVTMTTPACPMGDLITNEARSALEEAAPQGTAIEVQLVWDPPWTPDRMSQTAKETFGWAS